MNRGERTFFFFVRVFRPELGVAPGDVALERGDRRLAQRRVEHVAPSIAGNVQDAAEYAGEHHPRVRGECRARERTRSTSARFFFVRDFAFRRRRDRLHLRGRQVQVIALFARASQLFALNLFQRFLSHHLHLHVVSRRERGSLFREPRSLLRGGLLQSGFPLGDRRLAPVQAQHGFDDARARARRRAGVGGERRDEFEHTRCLDGGGPVTVFVFFRRVHDISQRSYVAHSPRSRALERDERGFRERVALQRVRRPFVGRFEGVRRAARAAVRSVRVDGFRTPPTRRRRGSETVSRLAGGRAGGPERRAFGVASGASAKARRRLRRGPRRVRRARRARQGRVARRERRRERERQARVRGLVDTRRVVETRRGGGIRFRAALRREPRASHVSRVSALTRGRERSRGGHILQPQRRVAAANERVPPRRAALEQLLVEFRFGLRARDERGEGAERAAPRRDDGVLGQNIGSAVIVREWMIIDLHERD